MTKAETVLNKVAEKGLEAVNEITTHIATNAEKVKQTGGIEPFAQVIRGIQAAKQNPLMSGQLHNLRQLRLTLSPLVKHAKHFVQQHHPAKVKEIYKALERDHPEYSAGKKARIANAKGQ